MIKWCTKLIKNNTTASFDHNSSAKGMLTPFWTNTFCKLYTDSSYVLKHQRSKACDHDILKSKRTALGKPYVYDSHKPRLHIQNDICDVCSYLSVT